MGMGSGRWNLCIRWMWSLLLHRPVIHLLLSSSTSSDLTTVNLSLPFYSSHGSPNCPLHHRLPPTPLCSDHLLRTSTTIAAAALHLPTSRSYAFCEKRSQI